MKLLLVRFKKWLIVKLGGYCEPPSPVVRFDRVDVPIRKLCFQGAYHMNFSHTDIMRMVADGLAEQICDAGLVKYEYISDPMLAPDVRFVRGTIRVVERREE